MAWQPTQWARAYGKILAGTVQLMRPRPGEQPYGPRFRWAVEHTGHQIELASGFADSLEAAGAAADAWIAELATLAGGVRR